MEIKVFRKRNLVTELIWVNFYLSGANEMFHMCEETWNKPMKTLNNTLKTFTSYMSLNLNALIVAADTCFS